LCLRGHQKHDDIQNIDSERHLTNVKGSRPIVWLSKLETIVTSNTVKDIELLDGVIQIQMC
jgi:hypothetical protein